MSGTIVRPILLLFSVLAWAVQADANQSGCGCITDSNYQDSENLRTYAIDTISGKRTYGSDYYNDNIALRVLFENKNVYLFNYKFSVTSDRLERVIIKKALNALGFKADIADISVAQSDLASGPQSRNQCSSFAKAHAALIDAGVTLTSAQRFIDGSLDRIRPLQSESATCVQLCDATSKAFEFFSATTFESAVKRQSLNMQTAKESLSNWGKWRAEANNEGGNCIEKLDGLEDKRKIATAAIEALDKGLADVTKYAAKVKEVHNSQNAFIDEIDINSTSEPMLHTVTIERDNADGSSNAWLHKIQVGRSRFSYSLGIGVSFINQVKYGVGKTNPGNSGSPPENVVRETERLDESMGVVGQINGEICRYEKVSVNWSFGASASEGIEGINFGFYTGPSLGLIDNKLLFTAAYHLMSVDKPDDGFKKGAILPADFTGDIPTSTHSAPGILATITWRLD